MEEKKSKRNKSVNGAPAVGADGWESIQTEYSVWKPEICRATPVQGYLLSRRNLPDGFGGQPWAAYVVKLTAPCLAVDLGSKVPVEKAAGVEVLVPETAQLRSLLRFLNPSAIVVVKIDALEKMKIEGGNTKWRYAVTHDPSSSVPRPSFCPSFSDFVPPVETKRRPVNDDIPF